MRIDSSMSYEDVKSTIDELTSGRVKILYVSPERFNNEGFQRLVSKLQVSLFVVDEVI
jgi:ATP-dependent DNA helicase RecQ